MNINKKNYDRDIKKKLVKKLSYVNRMILESK